MRRKALRGGGKAASPPQLQTPPVHARPAARRLRMHGLRKTLRGEQGVYDISIPPFKN